MKERVLLGMSGGVDSSVSAILLQQQGYEVIGCTMELWGKDEQNKAIEDAKNVCQKLGIRHYVLNYRKEFKCHVIDNFINEYKNARTPNPCVECNKNIKFGVLLQKAKELGCEYIATGHYARIEYSEEYNRYVLRKSKEEKKDQTYFLYSIPKEELQHILFPLQEYTSKQDTRKIAKENGLEVSEKKDSQEICFIPDNDYKKFLKDNINEKVRQNIQIDIETIQNGEYVSKIDKYFDEFYDQKANFLDYLSKDCIVFVDENLKINQRIENIVIENNNLIILVKNTEGIIYLPCFGN